jgi:hypothetical protein
MHCSDSLLVSYSSYMFQHMYVIIREPSCMHLNLLEPSVYFTYHQA